jgi:hypothetical protein
MPVAGDSARPVGDGLYEAVCERVEEDAFLHEERITSWPGDSANYPYPMRRILDALRAREPVDVPHWAVPQWAWIGQCVSRGRLTGQAVEAPWMYRAIVRPDDTVTFETDDGRAWIEENGL